MPDVGFRIDESITRPDSKMIRASKDLAVANIGDSVNRMFCMDSSIQKTVNGTDEGFPIGSCSPTALGSRAAS